MPAGMAAGPAGAASARPRSRVGDKRAPPVPCRGSVPFQPVSKSKHPFFEFFFLWQEDFGHPSHSLQLAHPCLCPPLAAEPRWGPAMGSRCSSPVSPCPGKGRNPFSPRRSLPMLAARAAGGAGGVNTTQPRLQEPGGVLVQTRLTRTFPPAAARPRCPAVVAVPQPGRAAAAGGTAASLAPGGPCNGLCESTQLNCHQAVLARETRGTPLATRCFGAELIIPSCHKGGIRPGGDSPRTTPAGL